MGNAACQMALQCVKKGHEVVVFTPRYRQELEKEESYDGLRVVRVEPLIKYGKAAILPQLFFRLKGFDILHLHYPFFGGAEWVWLFRKTHKEVKLVISYQMDVVGTGLKAAIFRAYTGLLLRSIVSSADRVIVSSYDYADHSYIGGMVKRDDLAEIALGADERFFPQEKDRALMDTFGIRPDDTVILFVGSFEYFKGIEFLLRSIPALQGKIRVLIVGDGMLRPQYMKLVEDLGIADRVSFPGLADDELLARYYNLCDIFILPSSDRTEAFGIVLIEAMACGKPVVASNLPGVRTVVEDGKNGFLVKPGDAADIADKLQRLIGRETVRREFGRRGREKVLERYTWDKVGDKLNSVYEEVLHGR
jgi:glycosyltransferase involved in cell wall biosynthesis